MFVEIFRDVQIDGSKTSTFIPIDKIDAIEKHNAHKSCVVRVGDVKYSHWESAEVLMKRILELQNEPVRVSTYSYIARAQIDAIGAFGI